MEMVVLLVLALVLTSMIMNAVTRHIREKEKINAKLKSAGLNRKTWDWTRPWRW